MFDAGMSPKQTDAERGVDMLETKLQREEISCRQTCLRIQFVVHTFRSTAKQQNVAPLSNNGASQMTLHVRERGASSKEEL